MNILIIHAHPVQNTYSDQLADAYIKGAKAFGAQIKEITLRDLDFKINFTEGYRGDQVMESDLIEAQEMIRWADHMVFNYPNWWGTFPAQLKGFIDRVFLPGFAFKYRKGSMLWDKLLSGKTARLIVTMDSPPWYYKWVVGAPGHRAMKKATLEFCGVKPVKISTIGSIKKSSEKQRDRWINQMERLGAKMI